MKPKSKILIKNLDVKNINIYGSWKWATRNYNLTREEADNYLSKLEPMTKEEIELFLKTPIEIKNNIIEEMQDSYWDDLKKNFWKFKIDR